MPEPFRILVTGGRNYADRHILFDVLDRLREEFGSIEIGVGYDPRSKKYQGADEIAYDWAKGRGVPGRCYPADWSVGRSAGPRRNERMLAKFKPQLVVAFLTTGAENVGTRHMMRIAGEAGVEVRVGSRQG